MEARGVDAIERGGIAPAPLGEPSAAPTVVQSGVRLFVATLVSLAANYIFLLAAGRLLGSSDYATLAALVGVLTVVLLPSGAVQMAVSREVSRLEATGQTEEAASFVRAILGMGAKATVPLIALALALVYPIGWLLQIDDTAAVAVAVIALVVAFVVPVALGALQGYQRFHTLAWVSAAPMVVRLAVLIVLALAGMRLFGALIALTASAVVGGAMAFWPVRHAMRRSHAVKPELGPFLRYLVPVFVGLLGVSLLTNGDILIVKARFSAEDAGVYAAASAFARIAFFLPSTLLSILFPRTAARQARGEQSGDILGRTLLVTVGFCSLLVVGYALIGDGLVTGTFGADFKPAAGLLVPFSIAMTLFSVVNVLVAYHLSRHESRYAWILIGGVTLQIVLLATVPTTLRGVLWLNVAVGSVLVLVHEVAVGSSIPAVGAGLERLGVAGWPGRAVAFVVGVRAALFEACVVLAGYSALAVAITWPLAAHLNGRLLGDFPNDGAGGAAWFWQLHHEAGYHFLGVTHHTYTGAPVGWDQGNALNFQWLWPYYPAYLLSGLVGEVAAINLVVLSGFALSAAAMYLLVRWLGCGQLVALWAGVVYMIFPWHIQRALAGHASLVHLEIFPIVLLAALAWLRAPSEKRALMVGITVVGAWLTSGYFGAMVLMMLFPIAAIAALSWRKKLGLLPAIRATIPLWGVPVMTTALFAIASLLVGGSEGVHLGRSVGNVSAYGAHLRDYLPDPLNRVAGSAASDLGSSVTKFPGTENSLYPGLVTVVLAVIAGVLLLRRKFEARTITVWALVSVTAVGVILAAPSPMDVFGLHVGTMPSLLVLDVLPAFRVPTRLAALIMVALICLAALALARLLVIIRRYWGDTGAVAIVAVLIGVSISELALVPMPMADIATPPPVYRAVAATPTGVLAEYPLQNQVDPSNSRYIFWQRFHQRPLLSGAAAYSSSDSIRRMLVDPSSRGTAASLAFLGVTAIITRPRTYDWNPFARTPDTHDYGSGYTLTKNLPGDLRVWRVTARPAPALAAYRMNYAGGPEERQKDGFVRYELLGNLGHIDIYATKPGSSVLSFEVRSGAGRTLVLSGANWVRRFELGHRTTIAVPLRLERGKATLTVGATAHGKAVALNALSFSGTWFKPSLAAGRQDFVRPKLLVHSPGF